jgi:hypothetical protein
MAILDDSKTAINFYTLYTEYNHLNGNKRAEKFLELCIYSYKSGGLKLLNCILDKEITENKDIVRALILNRCLNK